MKKQILIADDTESIAHAISLILEGEGFDVDIVLKSTDVFERALETQPDLVLLDMLMPGTNGTDICKALKFDERTEQIPIILISAHPTAEESAEKAGAEGFVPKPFDTDELVEIIKEALAATEASSLFQQTPSSSKA